MLRRNMNAADYYSTIFRRKSVRKYYQEPLNKSILQKIKKNLSTLKPIDPTLETEFKIISGSQVHTRMMRKAPHYIAAFSQKKDDNLMNIGFMLQQMDLYLSSNGIGSCWQGIPQPNREVLRSSRLEFIILMAFGKPKEELHRKSVEDFKRKSLEEITNTIEAKDLLEPVRLAPSATNSQPWYFEVNEHKIHAYSVKSNFLKKLFIKKYIPIDMGIALYHLKVSCEHQGKNVEILKESRKDLIPAGLKYVASVRCNNQ